MPQIKSYEELAKAAAASAAKAAKRHGVSIATLKVQRKTVTISPNKPVTWIGYILPPKLPGIQPVPRAASAGGAVLVAPIKPPIWVGIIAPDLGKQFIGDLQKQIKAELQR